MVIPAVVVAVHLKEDAIRNAEIAINLRIPFERIKIDSKKQHSQKSNIFYISFNSLINEFFSLII